ncbi:MAG: UTP--glucose-1-phosphate uridylyltransferase GalU [Clostridiaceae bacterium]
MRIRKAVIPAAGLGLRFLPATKAQPKEMLPIVDKPAIQYIVEEAVASGIEEILIITGGSKRSIEDHFDKSIELECELIKKNKQDLLKIVRDISDLANVYYIRQKDPRGLGHAIRCTKSFVENEPFAVMLGDDLIDSQKPCLKQLMDCFNEYKSTILGVQHVDKKEVSKHGIIKAVKIRDRVYKVEDLIEKPGPEEAPSNIAILGRYILMPEIFSILEKTKPGTGNKIELTDAIKTLSKKQAIYAYEFEGTRYDVGDKMGFLQATVEMALKREDLGSEFMKYLMNLDMEKV